MGNAFGFGISPALFFSNKRQEKPHFMHRLHYTSFGRDALYLAINILELTKKEKCILIPDYICWIVIDVLKKANMKYVFYPVKKDLSPDFEYVSKTLNTSNNINSILVVNYFGFPQDYNKIGNICKEFNLLFIENNTHSFLSRYNNRWLGTFGEAGIFSFRKIVPVPDGAGLYLKKNTEISDIISYKQARLSRKDAFLFWAKMFIRYFYNHSIDPFHLINYFTYNSRKLLADMDTNERFELPGKTPSKLFYRLIDKICFDDIIKKRNDNYSLLLRNIKHPCVAPIFPDVPEGVCPQNFPMIIKNGKRDELLLHLYRSGIRAYHWPTLPEEIKQTNGYSDAKWLRENILLLPIHQDLSEKTIIKLSSIINGF